jgi:hypothetical protein
MADQLHDVDASLDPRAALAPARDPLRRLLATGAWLWLARALPFQSAAPGSLVLLDHLSGLLVLVGTEAFRG